MVLVPSTIFYLFALLTDSHSGLNESGMSNMTTTQTSSKVIVVHQVWFSQRMTDTSAEINSTVIQKWPTSGAALVMMTVL